jgi:hypothetical protein
MTQPQIVERNRRLPLRQRPAALAAVGAACMLARLPPKHIRAVLTLLRRRAAPATHQQAKDALDAILAVSVLCGGRYCLQRSLATTLLCRIRGVWPTWCTGVRTAPFVAHAWVEADGRLVGEPHVPGYYRPLIVISPERDAPPVP